MEKASWKIVEAGAGHAPVMATFWCALMKEEAPPLLSVGDLDERRSEMAFARMLSQKNHYRAYISLSENGPGRECPSGFVLGSVYDRLYGEPRKVGQILHWYVLPSFRGSGMGRSLYLSLLAWFQQENVEILEVLARKEPARTKAWTDRGFTGVVDLFMMKPPWR